MRQIEKEEEERLAAANEENEDEEDRDTPVDGEGEDELAQEDEENKVELEIFYKSKDIHEALNKQKDDKFNELMEERQQIIKDNRNRNLNRFNIMEWLEEEATDESLSPLKKARTAQSRMMPTGEQDYEDEEAARLMQLKKKEKVDPDELKAKQTKQLHKVEQDLLKNEIENMVSEIVKKSEGKSNDGSQLNQSALGSQTSKKGSQ